MRVLRWLFWLLILAVATAGVYFYLEKKNSQKASVEKAVDMTTEEDRRQLDELLERLQKKKSPGD